MLAYYIFSYQFPALSTSSLARKPVQSSTAYFSGEAFS